jgi:hypothetical protein
MKPYDMDKNINFSVKCNYYTIVALLSHRRPLTDQYSFYPPGVSGCLVKPNREESCAQIGRAATNHRLFLLHYYYYELAP